MARTGAGLVLTDSADALRMVATLPDTSEARDAVALVKAGVLGGLSVEIAEVQHRMDGATRIVHSARLVGIGVVDNPAFPASTVEAHRRTDATAATPADDLAWWTV